MSTAEAGSPVASGATVATGPDAGRAGPRGPRVRQWFHGSRADGGAGGRWLVAIWAAELVGLLVEAPGRIVFDTKADVVLAPGRFLGQLAHLWSSQGGFGGLQD